MMRRLALTLAVLMLTSCIVVPLPGGRGSVTLDPLLPIGIGEAVKQIRKKLDRVRNDIPERQAKLRSFDCGSDRCYSADDVQAALAKIRQEVNDAFPDVAAASRLTLDADIAKDIAEQLAARRAAPTIVLVSNPPAAPPRAIPKKAVDAAFSRMRGHIDTYVSHDVLNPTITVTSEPPGANVTMTIGKTQLRTRTDDEIQSVWRGRYDGAAQKAGYRDAIPFTVDLMNDDRTKLRCAFVALSAPPSEESSCRLEK